jgi:hypothetical protein
MWDEPHVHIQAEADKKCYDQDADEFVNGTSSGIVFGRVRSDFMRVGAAVSGRFKAIVPNLQRKWPTPTSPSSSQ